MCVCPAAIPTLCLLLQCSLLEVLTQQSQLQLHRQITSKPRNRLCTRSNFLQHKKLSLRGKLPGSFAHPFFPLFSFPKCRSWKGIHSSGMSTGIYSFQFCLPNDKMLLAEPPPSSPAWSPLWYSGLQGHFQLLLQKQVHVFVTPIQHEVALQIFSFYSPFTSWLLLLSSPVTLEEFHLPFRVSL